MLKIQRLSLVLSLLVLSLPGCGSGQAAKDVWKTTKSYYHEYLNTPAVLKLDDIGDHAEYERSLGAAMTDIDQKLRQLMRAMDDSDRGVNNEWVNAMARRFPWLSGLAVVNGSGDSLARVPDFSLKEFDVKPLLVEDPRQKRSSLRAYVQEGPLGPEVYLAKPVYVDNALQAMVVAHFDPRALMAATVNPEMIAVFSPAGELWPAIYDIDYTPLKNANWEKLVKGDTSGTVSNKNGSFYWSSMYFANLPIIYAMPSKGEFPLKPEQLEVLRAFGSFGAAPPVPPRAAPAPAEPAALPPVLPVEEPKETAMPVPAEEPVRDGVVELPIQSAPAEQAVEEPLSPVEARTHEAEPVAEPAPVEAQTYEALPDQAEKHDDTPVVQENIVEAPDRNEPILTAPADSGGTVQSASPIREDEIISIFD